MYDIFINVLNYMEQFAIFLEVIYFLEHCICFRERREAQLCLCVIFNERNGFISVRMILFLVK